MSSLTERNQTQTPARTGPPGTSVAASHSRWWREGDTVLRRHALLCMDCRLCPDIVLPVASDPDHPLHAEAVGLMAFCFDLPEYERVKIAALSHPDPKVRAAAADVLFFDEPVVAEGPLIEATRDDAPEVAAEAANTLEYYPSLRTVRCLHGLLGHANDKVRAEALDSYESIRGAVLNRLCGRDRQVADHVRSWLQPVWGLLACTQEELRPDVDLDTPARQKETKEALPGADLLAMLADADVSPVVLGDRLRENGWPCYGVDDRRRLRAVLLSHPDPLVRECAASAFADWHDAESLVALAGDPDSRPRGSPKG